MMLQILKSLPKNRIIALSGGSDSMAVMDFCRRFHNCRAIFVDHKTETSRMAREFLTDWCSDNSLVIDIHEISRTKEKDESWEEFWRNERLKIFWAENEPVITGHNLDDCAETWLWSSCHGTPKIIPYNNRNIIRPFMLNRKSELRLWCERNQISWIEDESNSDLSYMRNLVRHRMMPEALSVNPGFYKVIAKKVKDARM